MKSAARAIAQSGADHNKTLFAFRLPDSRVHRLARDRMSQPTPLTCAVMIATRNRRDELMRALAEVAKLHPPPQQIVVCADGCSDDTEEFVRTNYPHVSLLIHSPARGSIASRDAMMRSIRADLVLSLDDDSYPLDRDFLSKAIALFEANPKLAVADFEQQSDEVSPWVQPAGDGSPPLRGSYSSASAVIRRRIYLELDGYPPFFFHAYEEPDFALRCIAAGYEVRQYGGLKIRHHFTGAQRNEIRTHHFHARNELWSVMLRCPWPWLPLVAAFRAARQLGYAWHRGVRWVIREPQWWWQCLRGLPCCFANRKPLSWAAYLQWMKRLRSR